MVNSQPHNNPAPGLSPFRGAFVGREREMGELKAALEDAVAGEGRVVMLAGEPGIGKTRTAQELVYYAEARGAKVLWGWCYEGEGAPPYWPWVSPPRSYIQQIGPEKLAAVIGPGAADIAEIIPEVKEKLPNLDHLPSLDPDQARFRLFDSITTFLKNAAQSQPLMLVLDDLHWADRSSLLLLEFLARHVSGNRLFIVGCYRDMELARQHPLAETLAQLSRESTFQRHLLQGLSTRDTGRFIETAAGVTPSLEFLNIIYAHTEGNPFFMTEVVRLLFDRNELITEASDEPQEIRIPPGVREVIGQRLNRLSEQCNQALITASIIGREFTLRLLSRLLSSLSDEQLLTALDEALQAHLIEEVPGHSERYQFSHSLIQSTLGSELSAARQARIHAQIGEALEELYGANSKSHAAELAYHFGEAVAATDIHKLAHYSLIAGEQALAAYAHEEALLHFQRALAVKGGQPTDSETAALLFGLGKAQTATLERHQLHEAVASLRGAFDYYVGVGDVDQAGAVAQFPLNSATGQRTGLARLIADALALVNPDSLEAGRLLSRYGRVLGIEEGDYDGAQQALNRALVIAKDEGDAFLEMWTLANAVQVAVYHLRFPEALEKGPRAIDMALELDDPHAQLFARFYTATVLRRTGNLTGFRRQALAMLAPAERLRDHYWLISAYQYQADVAYLEGQWQTAQHFYDQGLAISPREPRLLGRRTTLEYEAGDFSQGEAYLERLIEAMHLTEPGPPWCMELPR